MLHQPPRTTVTFRVVLAEPEFDSVPFLFEVLSRDTAEMLCWLGRCITGHHYAVETVFTNHRSPSNVIH